MGNFMKLLRKHKTPVTAAATLLFLVAATVLSIFYLQTVKTELGTIDGENAKSITQKALAEVQEKFDAEKTKVKNKANELAVAGKYDSEAAKSVLSLWGDTQAALVRTIVTDSSGMSYRSDDKSGSMLDNESVALALNGRDVISLVGEDTVMLSVPMLKDGVLAGALSCLYKVEIYGSVIGIDKPSAPGSYCVTDAKGLMIAAPQKLGTGSLINVALVSDPDAKSELTGLVGETAYAQASKSYPLEGKETTMTSIPLGIADWRLVSFIPASALTGKTPSVFYFVAISMGVVLAILVAVLVIQFIRQYRMEKSVEYSRQFNTSLNIENGERLKIVFAKLPNKGKDYTYIHFRVVHFKKVLSAFGYDVGNGILRSIGEALKTSVDVKENELAVHLQDNAFGILIKPVESDDLAIRLGEIVSKIATVGATDSERVFAYTCVFSCGVYRISGEEESLSEVCTIARFTARLAKSPEIDPVVYYSDQLQEQVHMRNKLLPFAHQALQEKQIVPYMQPKYDKETKKIRAAELFARWKHPQYGIISPADFLSVLEISGDMYALDLYMLEEACILLKTWVDSEQMPVPLSVNISKSNFMEANFMDNVLVLMRQYNAPACLINIEVEQSALMSEQEMLVETMQKFHEHGFILSIDDFGKDIVPIDMLTKYTIDIINISPDFIKQAQVRKDYRTLLETVVKSAQAMNIMVSVEGVETPRDEAFWESLHCDMMQGYLYSKPMPKEDFEKVIF